MNTLQQKNNNKVVFLFGPTAVGKTDLLCSLFVSDYEVINADSVQVYRKLDIGSAKASMEMRKTIEHHLIDILDPWENWNVATFIENADKACTAIREKGKIPVLSGGTAYYFKHFLYGLSQAPKSDPQIREEVSSYIQNVGNIEAHEYLCSVDPVSGSKINVNDVYRISRALEVYKTCNRPLSDFAIPDKIRNNMDVLVIGLKRDKEDLKSRISKRVDIMFEMGLIDEIKMLIEMGANSSWQSMQAIGYSEFINALKDKDFSSLDIDEIKNQIVMNSIHYAKRQMTFFNSFADVNWVHPEDIQSIKKLLSTFERS